MTTQANLALWAATREAKWRFQECPRSRDEQRMEAANSIESDRGMSLLHECPKFKRFGEVEETSKKERSMSRVCHKDLWKSSSNAPWMTKCMSTPPIYNDKKFKALTKAYTLSLLIESWTSHYSSSNPSQQTCTRSPVSRTRKPISQTEPYSGERPSHEKDLPRPHNVVEGPIMLKVWWHVRVRGKWKPTRRRVETPSRK